jgi:hypothetical protein
VIVAADEPDDSVPSIHQRVHAATGDREAEAKVLAKDAGRNVDEDDARIAVRRAHGDLESPDDSAETSEHDIATPADAVRVHERRD